MYTTICYHDVVGQPANIEKLKDMMHAQFEVDSELWKRRPLKKEYLEYAASDVAYLEKLRSRMLGCGFTASTDRLIQIWKIASERNADLLRHNSKTMLVSLPYTPFSF